MPWLYLLRNLQYGHLLTRVSFFIWIMINPCQPIPLFCHIFDLDEVITPDGCILDPEFEALILEFESIINLNLIKPMLIWSHILHRIHLRVCNLLICDSIWVLLSWCSGLFCSTSFVRRALQLLQHLYLIEQAHYISHEYIIQQYIYLWFQKGNKVLWFDELGIHILLPFDTQIFAYLFDLTQCQWIYGICCFQSYCDQLVQLLNESVYLLHPGHWCTLLRFAFGIGLGTIINLFILFVFLHLGHMCLMSLSCKSFFCANLLYIVQSIIRVDKRSLILFHLEDFEALAVTAVLTVGIEQVLELLEIPGFHGFILVYEIIVFWILLPYGLVDCVLSWLLAHLDEKLLLVVKQLLFINLILIRALMSNWILWFQESLVCSWMHLMRDYVHLVIMFLGFWFLLGQAWRKTHRVVIMPLSIRGLIRWMLWIQILRMIIHYWLRILFRPAIWSIFVSTTCLSSIIWSTSIIDCLSLDIQLEFIRIVWLY